MKSDNDLISVSLRQLRKYFLYLYFNSFERELQEEGGQRGRIGSWGASSQMVWFMPYDLHRAIELFGEDEACHLVRKGHRTDGNLEIRPLLDILPIAIGTADHEVEMARPADHAP